MDGSSYNTTDINDANLDRSLSDSEMQTSFVSARLKRRREDDLTCDFAALKKEMQSMFKNIIEAQSREFAKNTVILQAIQQTNNNIESSVAFLTAQNEEFRHKIKALEDKSNEDQKYISVLEEKLEITQQDLRKTNIEIKNVPKKQNETKEDLVNMTLNLSKTVGCTLEKSSIRDIYRARGKRDTNTSSPIIVETNSTFVKNDILRACKAFNVKQKTKLCAKHLGHRTNEDTPIYIAEQLTPKAARLYFLARDLVKAKSYKYCWTAYGRVYLRMEDNTPIILAKYEAQIHQLIINK